MNFMQTVSPLSPEAAQSPVIPSIVNLTSSLIVKLLTVPVSTFNSQVFLLNKGEFVNAKAAHIFSAKILAYIPYIMIRVLKMR